MAVAGFCCLALLLGLGLGCGLTGKNCVPNKVVKVSPPPSPLVIPPSGSAYVASTFSLGGYTAATFTPPVATAFVTAVTTTIGIASSRMSVLSDSRPAVNTGSGRRLLLDAFLVSFVITAQDGTSADVLVAVISSMPASSAFNTALQSSFTSASLTTPSSCTLVSSVAVTVGVPAPPVYLWSPPVRAVRAQGARVRVVAR